MAKMIGKEKGSMARGRVAASAEADSVSDLANDEAQSVDNVTPDDENDAFVVSPAVETESAEEIDSQRIVARRSSSALSRASIPAPLMANPITRFIAEAYIELRKVTWPTWSDAWTMTLIVVAMSALIAAVLGLADLGLTHALQWIVSLGTK